MSDDVVDIPSKGSAVVDDNGLYFVSSLTREWPDEGEWFEPIPGVEMRMLRGGWRVAYGVEIRGKK